MSVIQRIFKLNIYKTLNHRKLSTTDTNDFIIRKNHINSLIENKNWIAYPNKYKSTTSIYEFINKYDKLSEEDLDANSNTIISISGRIKSRRDASNKLIFIDIDGSQCLPITNDNNNYINSSIPYTSKLQLALKNSEYKGKNYDILLSSLRRGDIVGINGYPYRTKVGQLSLMIIDCTLLSPCLHIIPEELTNIELKSRSRHLDFIIHPENLSPHITKSIVLKSLRTFLDSRGFLEVETPILWTSIGGAVARPFLTKSHFLDIPLSLRIAPELFLKRLVISGMDRVYEISKVFRNEDMDATHNPEFTICEFYLAYADVFQIMELTKTLLQELAIKTVGKLSFPLVWSSDNVDFSEFYIIEIMPALEEALGKLPSLELINSNDPTAIQTIKELGIAKGMSFDSFKDCVSSAKVLDKCIGHFIEPRCIQPTFLMGHPKCLSPLAKSSPENPELTERFELFIGCKEICNAYSELNDPLEQRRRFALQEKEKKAGDDEAPLPDESFCQALEYGLPPTGGWGIGIDRLCMLFSQKNHIRDVLFFPLLKPEKPAEKKL